MFPPIDDDDDFLAALCFDQRNGEEDPYAFIHPDQENLFPDFGSCGVNLEAEHEQICNNTRPHLDSLCENVLQHHFTFGGPNHDSAQHVIEVNSSSSVGTVKPELEHVEEECSRKRGRTGSCSKSGTKACREKMRREMLNDKFMDLSSLLEPTRTPKTDKSAILDDAIRVVNQLRGETHELKETNHKLLQEIKSLKVEKNELREEKLVLKADKEKMEQRLKSMAVPSPGFMPSHPVAFHPHKMAVYPSYGYYPNMPMWPYLPPGDRDTTHDHQNTSHAA